MRWAGYWVFVCLLTLTLYLVLHSGSEDESSSQRLMPTHSVPAATSARPSTSSTATPVATSTSTSTFASTSTVIGEATASATISKGTSEELLMEKSILIRSDSVFDMLAAKIASGAPLRITIHGGSASAFHGDNTWHAMLARWLEKTFEIEVILSNGAHGATDSLWCALLLDSLFVEDADLIVWEYAINDFRDPVLNLQTYLERLQVMRENLPELLFLYLWDRNGLQTFTGNTEKAQLPVLEAARGSFPLGAVSARDAVSSIGAKKAQVLKPRDPIHPNDLGNLIIFKLLKTYFTPGSGSQVEPVAPLAAAAAPVGPPRSSPLPHHRSTSLLSHTPHGTSRWTQSARNAESLRGGKSSGDRNDRQLQLLVPLCSSGRELELELQQSRSVEERRSSALGSEGHLWTLFLSPVTSRGAVDMAHPLESLSDGISLALNGIPVDPSAGSIQEVRRAFCAPGAAMRSCLWFRTRGGAKSISNVTLCAKGPLRLTLGWLVCFPVVGPSDN